MDHLEPGVVGIERALMVGAKTLERLVAEHKEAKKKLDDKSVESNKKTFLKAQIPKMEAEIKATKAKVEGLLEAEELDPRGEWYVLALKLLK